MTASPARPAPVETWLAAVRESHQRLVDCVAGLTDDQLSGPSYDDEWTIAQVLSHLGSGAEIFSMVLLAGREGRSAPGLEEFQPVWGRWNAKPAMQQVHDAIAADAAFLDQLGSLDAHQLADWRIVMFGDDQDLVGLLRLRLGEHAVHTWDVAVVRDSNATLAPSVVDLLVDPLDQLVRRVAKPTDAPVAVRIVTERPPRQLRLRVDDDGASLTAGDGTADVVDDPVLHLPAEALVRLVYGRLDPHHTPPLDATGVDLDLLRRVFPGF